MKKEVVIKITLTDDNITLDVNNPIDLTENDIIGSIKLLISLNKTLSFFTGRRPHKWKCVNSSSRDTPTGR